MKTERLSVYLHQKLVGHLERTRGGARFAYAPGLVDAYAGLPVLSVALPVKARPYGEGLTNVWFSGLLPEGERLTRPAALRPPSWRSTGPRPRWCLGGSTG